MVKVKKFRLDSKPSGRKEEFLRKGKHLSRLDTNKGMNSRRQDERNSSPKPGFVTSLWLSRKL